MTNDKNGPPKTGFAAKWGAIAAVLAAFILVIDFLTKSIGLVETIEERFFGNTDPVVLAKTVTFENSSSCLEFAFKDLPESFSLGEIELMIVGSEGPDQISGDMASNVFEKTVNDELSPAYLIGQKTKIIVPARVQATKPQDAFFLSYCPTLTVPGTKGSITVVPTFRDPAGEEVTSINVETDTGDPIEQGIQILLIRPKNERVTVVGKLMGLISE